MKEYNVIKTDDDFTINADSIIIKPIPSIDEINITLQSIDDTTSKIPSNIKDVEGLEFLQE